MSIITNIPSASDYASADRSGKSNMRSMATNAMMAAIDARDMDTATAWRTALESWKSNTSTIRVIDYASACRDRIATLRMAATAIESGLVRPTGVPDETELTFEESGTADVAMATRIASESVTRSEKSDLVGSIADCVVDHMTPGRFYTATEIAHMTEKYAPAYAGRRVSTGAVTNALRGGKVTGVTFGHNGTANGATRES